MKDYTLFVDLTHNSVLKLMYMLYQPGRVFFLDMNVGVALLHTMIVE